MKIKIIPLLFIFILCLVIVSSENYATPFNVSVKGVVTEITKDDKADFIINITNLEEADKFSFVYPNDPSWSFTTSPTRLTSFLIQPNESSETHLFIKPTDYAFPSRHKIPLEIRTQSGYSETVDLSLFYKVPYKFWYETDPHLEFSDFKFEKEIDPRNENFIEVVVKNRNALSLQNVKINLKSNLIDVTKTIDIDPLEKTTLKIKLPYSIIQEPTTDKLTINWAVRDNASEYFFIGDVDIKGYESFFKKNITEEKSGLKKITTIRLFNPGTLSNSQEISIKAKYFERLFSSSNFDYEITKDKNGKYISWYVELGPQEERTIILTTSYVPLIIILIILVIIIVALIILFLIFRSPIQVRKRGLILKIMEGGISELKIVLNVKNISSHLLENIEIIDIIPNITEIEHEFEVGTLKPVKILNNKKKGTIVKWEIPTLEKYEERIITYKLKSKLSILGGLTLPSAIVRFKRDNKRLRSYSNKFKLEMPK